MGEASDAEASEEDAEVEAEASDEESSDEYASGSEEESSDEESSEEASSAGDVLSAKKIKTEEVVIKDNSKPTEQSLRFYTGRDGTRFGKTFRQLEQGWVGVGSSSECHPLSQPKNLKRCHFEKAPQPVTGKIGRSPAKANRRKR